MIHKCIHHVPHEFDFFPQNYITLTYIPALRMSFFRNFKFPWFLKEQQSSVESITNIKVFDCNALRCIDWDKVTVKFAALMTFYVMPWRGKVLDRWVFVLDQWIFVLDRRVSVLDRWVFVLDQWVFVLNQWVFVLEQWGSALDLWVFILDQWVFVLDQWVFLLDHRVFGLRSSFLGLREIFLFAQKSYGSTHYFKHCGRENHCNKWSVHLSLLGTQQNNPNLHISIHSLAH